MSITRRAVNKRAFLPSGAGDPWAIPSNGSLAAYTSSGVPVTEDTAMQLLAVAACVRLLATTVGGLPFDAVQMSGAVRRTLEPPPLIISDPFGGANNLKWPTRRTGFVQLMVSLLLRGNGYAMITGRDEDMRPSRIAVLHPDRVAVGVDGDGSRKYEVNRQPVPAYNMVHLLGLSMPESPIGMSVIEYARQAIGLGLAAEEFGARFFGSGAHLSGVIEVPGDLDRDRARQLKETFQASHGGLRNAHTVGVLSGGARWAPISVSPEDAQFLGTRAAQNLDIAMLFGIPPHMLGQVDRTTSWGCLPGDSLVFTTGGPVPIENVHIGDEVWSFGEAGMQPAKVTGWQMTGYKPLLTIRTTAREIRLTANHRVPVRRYFGIAEGRSADDCRWETVEVCAGEVREGDFLLVPHGMDAPGCNVAPSGRHLTVGAMEFCGLYLGDGSRDLNRIEIAHEREPLHMDYYSQLVRDEFGVEPYRDDRRTRFSSTAAIDLLEQGFTGTAHTKRIPGWVFGLSPQLQLGLLRGYLDSDGSVQRGRIIYSSANRMLLEDVRHLCMQLGIPVGRVCLGRPAGKGVIRGREVNSTAKYQLSLSSLSFNVRIGSNSPVKAARLTDKPTSRRLRYDKGWSGGLGRSKPPRLTPGGEWPHSDVRLQKVVSIERGTVATPVYDIEVAGLAHFVADGVVVHNTGIEQQTLGFLKYTLSNWIGIFEETWSAMLPEPQVARMNVAGLLRTDTAGRYAVYTQARNTGVMTIDEIRALEDMAPLPDGKGADPFAPLNSAHAGGSGDPAPGGDAVDPGAHSAQSDADSGQQP